MTLSLAFPDATLIEVAARGRLPRGYGVSRPVDLPDRFEDQWRAPGRSREFSNSSPPGNGSGSAENEIRRPETKPLFAPEGWTSRRLETYLPSRRAVTR